MIWNEDRSFVVDIQITSDSNVAPIENLHQLKRKKYDNQAIKAYVFTKTGSIPEVTTVTLNWRGIMARSSLRILKDLGLSSADISLISVRAVEGGSTTYSNYMGTSGGGDIN